MLATFPAPVLSVTTDAVRDLEGREALSGLWTLFTKCKESLQDGRRLENISWRLWYRELSQSQQQAYHPLTPDSSSSVMTDCDGRSPFFSSTTCANVSVADGLLNHHVPSGCYQQAPSPTSTASHVDDERPSISPLQSTVSAPFSSPGGPGKPSSFVGRMIIDMLPQTVLVCKKPTNSLGAPRALPGERQKPQQPQVPSVRLPSSPSSTQTSFPRVVVVNPTPHPTPPTTPILHNDRPGAPQPPSTYLLPPLPPPALSSMRTAPRHDPPSSMGPSSPSAPVRSADEPSTKASDRRFFLQQSPEEASPERNGSLESGKSPSDFFEVSSVASSQMKSITDTEERSERSSKSRRGKEGGKHAVRPMARRTHSTRHVPPIIAQRKSSGQEGGGKPRAMFNIGSGSSNGSKGANSSSTNGPSSNAPPSHAPAPVRGPSTVAQPHPRLPSPPPVAATNGYQRKTIIVASTSSEEYETTDADDSEWASEEMDAEDKVKQKQKQAEEHRLREAALEAQRQRDLFAKVPKRSYSNLNRTQSGLLSQLMNPPPQIFPPNHPYRTSQSSHDITQLPHHAPQRSSSGFAPSRLQTSKSTAALPLASQFTAMTVSSKPPVPNGNTKDREKVGYRPKGRPREEEMEEDSGEENDNDDKIQVSRSVAQQKLQALMSRRGSDQSATSQLAQQAMETAAVPLAPAATAPIPLGHPYNLPAPAPPMTPRTTRRRMLRTELSESMRRQLLWERQVSSTNNPAAGARRTNGGPLGGLRPLTSSNSGVEVRGAAGNHSSTTKSAEAEDKDERKRKAMARNRSWADDYHYSGW
ncbi:hypothetical protein BV22DRAFT_1087227 [Leucogyrophana mollusca]|uniref:Uncharacterized protein n=1 Tax=Leucogyrophana mollusca TaxID=85980 RepID=A0ACB8BNE9_9AGAM|nr:hypothetical protein BV22DRAFT_1087227 [Leucogyrophana mollusca]